MSLSAEAFLLPLVPALTLLVSRCRCQAILRQVMLRRKKDSKLDGKALITLPPKTVELRTLEFSPEEREICTLASATLLEKFLTY